MEKDRMQFTFADYAEPTWKLGDDEEENFQELRHQAMHKILTGGVQGFNEVAGSAQVSINNKHHCRSCYCCAAWSVLSEIKRVEAD